MKTISFNATKGGTGKSTLSIITLNALTKMGFRCLAIDADMINHSLSFYFNAGLEFDTIKARNVFNMFISESVQDNVISINDRLDLIHGDVRLTEFRTTTSLKHFKKIIKAAEGYDYVVIDTSPTYDNITANVFYASDSLIIPVVPDVFNLQSVNFLFAKLKDLELDDLDKTIIFNQHDRARTDNQNAFSNQITNIFTANMELNPFIGKTSISRHSAIKKYINDRSYSIKSGPKSKTLAQFTEIKDFIQGTLGITLTVEEI